MAVVQSQASEPGSEPASGLTDADEVDYFRAAVNRANSAVSIGQSAQSPEDWQLAAGRWQQAVELMRQVPATSDNYAVAQAKVKEYQGHLAAAQQRVQAPAAVATVSQVPSQPDGLVARIPIRERRGGTPVVSVAMEGQKGRQEFTMLFDTGATLTLITQQMASALGVVIVDEVTVTIADGSRVNLPVAYVDVLEVGGLRREGVYVAIGGSVGLLGQDIYGDYGISMGASSIDLYR